MRDILALDDSRDGALLVVGDGSVEVWLHDGSPSAQRRNLYPPVHFPERESIALQLQERLPPTNTKE